MRRCSLDRVILKIKLMNEEKEYGYIFEIPFEVLGRAIQPPDIKNIKFCLKHLIEIGAL